MDYPCVQVSPAYFDVNAIGDPFYGSARTAFCKRQHEQERETKILTVRVLPDDEREDDSQNFLNPAFPPNIEATIAQKTLRIGVIALKAHGHGIENASKITISEDA
eukprot:scaffold40538_cov41-Prasinocladus_malaysianus.AAC.2